MKIEDNPYYLFQSRYRAASHFRDSEDAGRATDVVWFQSRYRAASHFRRDLHHCACPHLPVSISLSSGFSFQGFGAGAAPFAGLHSFNLVIERLLISGQTALLQRLAGIPRFNLVIERLLISGSFITFAVGVSVIVSISLSSGFSFQG